jgi:hypothetical protein
MKPGQYKEIYNSKGDFMGKMDYKGILIEDPAFIEKMKLKKDENQSECPAMYRAFNKYYSLRSRNKEGMDLLWECWNRAVRWGQDHPYAD